MMGLSLTQISTKFGILVGRHVSWTWGGGDSWQSGGKGQEGREGESEGRGVRDAKGCPCLDLPLTVALFDSGDS